MSLDSETIIYLVMGGLFLVSQIKRALAAGREAPRPGPPEPRDPAPSTPLSQSTPGYRQGGRLQQVLREFERALEQAEAAGRDVKLPLPEEEVEEPESLEAEPEVVSLEREVRRAPRQEFTQDQDAEQLVARRITAASARDSARGRRDQGKVDSPIRQEPADHTATRGYTAEQLRRAVIWREILGRPVSER
jgi:hypothetical protein